MYIDGFNLYHAIKALRRPELKWLDLTALARSFLEKRDTLVNVVHFTALKPKDGDKYHRHLAYIAACEAVGVEVIRSKFQRDNKYCEAFSRYCDFDEEKRTDVAFAVRVLRDVQSGAVDRVILITADSDQIPLVEEIRESFATVKVEIAAPPGRLKQARQLCGSATRFHEISAGRLGTCPLPRNVTDERGGVVARCPSKYLAAT
jgi:uncharacterized LabA/DUF88 family protein